jgi:hypothetical protein
MSRDIKYIGMDVHKEATVIAVLNGSGKLVMESIVETEASSILQAITLTDPSKGWLGRVVNVMACRSAITTALPH